MDKALQFVVRRGRGGGGRAPRGKTQVSVFVRCAVVHAILGVTATWILLVASVKPALALAPAKNSPQFVKDVWQSEQGLPQDSVSAICQARDGYLWLGTNGGLVCFDGVRFTVFEPGNTPG
ncbi:MAG TPA: two-component regulator propeller domain-containing protein, partial [Blastocatellia bacterium]|nr:two-component regulator propeller domain-containing protein [Blastocatellia bacterium]